MRQKYINLYFDKRTKKCVKAALYKLPNVLKVEGFKGL